MQTSWLGLSSHMQGVARYPTRDTHEAFPSSRAGSSKKGIPIYCLDQTCCGGNRYKQCFAHSAPRKRTCRNLNFCEAEFLKEMWKMPGDPGRTAGYFILTFLKCLLGEIYFLGDLCAGLEKTRGNLTVKMCIFSCETPEYSLGFTLFYSQGKLCMRSTSQGFHNQSLNLVIGRGTFVFSKFGITAKGSLACCVSLVPARRCCCFIHTRIHGLAMLDKDNWKSFVLFGIQTNSSPHTLH